MSSRNSCVLPQELEDNFGFAAYFRHLLKNKRCIDVTFILDQDGEEICAHQMILAMRSSYFADLFYGDEKEKENKIIRLEKVGNPKAFKDMIRYCYDSKPGLEAHEEICSLFRVAYRFKVTSLMNICHTSLLDIQVMPLNVFSMLEVSEYVKDKKLRYKCYTFLQEKTKDIIESHDKTQLTPDMVQVILNLPKLSLHSEYELTKWLIEWATAKVEEGNMVCRNAREYLRSFLQDMKFLALTFEEFAKLCKDYPDFFTSEEIACICLNIAHPGTREMPEWYGKKLKIREYIRSKANVTDKDIVEAGKCVTNILALEDTLKCFKETVTSYLDSIKKRKETYSESKKIISVMKYYTLLRMITPCYTICIKLTYTVQKREELETFEIDEVKDFHLFSKELIGIIEGGGLKYMLEKKEEECKNLFDSDEGFEEVKEYLANEEVSKQCQEELKKAEEYQTMKKISKIVRDLEVYKILENLDKMYELYLDCDCLNEFSKEMRSLVIKRIKRLVKDYFEFLRELNQLIDKKNRNILL